MHFTGFAKPFLYNIRYISNIDIDIHLIMAYIEIELDAHLITKFDEGDTYEEKKRHMPKTQLQKHNPPKRIHENYHCGCNKPFRGFH